MIVELGQLWLHSVIDPSDCMAFEVHDLHHSPKVNVRIDAYAGGNYRAVRVAGRQKSATLTLSFCTDAQVAWLKAKQGVILWYRDPRGEKFAGLYDDPGFDPRKIADSWSVGLAVSEVTVSEAV